MSTRETLLEMGFDAKVVERALNHNEELGAAIDWIENHPEASEDVVDSDGTHVESQRVTAPAIAPEDLDETAAAARATTPSTTTTDPRSIEERLAEMQAKAAERKKEAEKKDAIERRRNEEISRKNQQKTRDAKRELELKQAQKIAAQRKKEALEDKLYREKLRQQIEQDKRERLARQSSSPLTQTGESTPVAQSQTGQGSGQPNNQPNSQPSRTGNVRLRVRSDGKVLTLSLDPSTTVAQLGHQLETDLGLSNFVLTTTYPPSSVDPTADQRTLREAGLDNASLEVKLK